MFCSHPAKMDPVGPSVKIFHMANRTGEIYLIAALEYILEWTKHITETLTKLGTPSDIRGILSRIDNDIEITFP